MLGLHDDVNDDNDDDDNNDDDDVNTDDNDDDDINADNDICISEWNMLTPDDDGCNSSSSFSRCNFLSSYYFVYWYENFLGIINYFYRIKKGSAVKKMKVLNWNIFYLTLTVEEYQGLGANEKALGNFFRKTP